MATRRKFFKKGTLGLAALAVKPPGDHFFYDESETDDFRKAAVTDSSTTDGLEEDVDEYLMPLFHKQLSELTAKIIAIEPEPDFKLGFITDSHYIDNSFPARETRNYLHARNIAELSLLQDIDLIVHGGDISYDYSTKQDLISCILKTTKELRKAKCPVAIVQGNHDTGDMSAFLKGRDPRLMISPKEWGRLISIDNDNRVYGDFSRSYYFKDFEDKKIRVIVLNTHDAWFLGDDEKVKYNRGQNIKGYPRTEALKAEQLEWFATDALNFEGKDNYGVIIISHSNLTRDLRVGRPAPVNYDVAEGLIVARKNKTRYASKPTEGDFGQNIQMDYSTANDVDIICCINGHSHEDIQIVRNGITFISTTCSRDKKDTSKLTGNDAWDVFNINTAEKKVKVKRFGTRGKDREFSY